MDLGLIWTWIHVYVPLYDPAVLVPAELHAAPHRHEVLVEDPALNLRPADLKLIDHYKCSGLTLLYVQEVVPHFKK